MRPSAGACCAMFMVITAAWAGADEPGSEEGRAMPQGTLTGQVVLPPGEGSRGIEVIVTLQEAGSEPHKTWLLFDEEGRFSHTFRDRLVSVTVTTGLRAELHRIEAGEMPRVNQSGQIDVGAIDLRDQLVRHRLALRSGEGGASGDVRMAMCFGLPPMGPQGGRVALGSRQFPPVAIGGEVEWLLPQEADSVYFLVERPGRGGEWRGGQQRLFGPFTLRGLPTELTVD